MASLRIVQAAKAGALLRDLRVRFADGQLVHERPDGTDVTRATLSLEEQYVLREQLPARPTMPVAPRWRPKKTADWSTYRYEQQGGPIVQGDAARFGLPAAPGGPEVPVWRFETVDPSRPHSKFYKGWDVPAGWPQFGGAARIDDTGRRFDQIAAGEESGVYHAEFFVPADYRLTASGNVAVQQFKRDAQGSKIAFRSDPTQLVSWLNAATLREWYPRAPIPSGLRDSAHPIMYLALGNVSQRRPYPPVTMPVPLGRWFSSDLSVVARDRVEWRVDGKLVDTTTQAEFPVGVQPDDDGWTYGIGHYSTNIGRIYIANAYVA